MDTSTSLTNKNALDLLKGISLSTNLQKSNDSILLVEDQHPENLDSIFGNLVTDLTNTLDLLKWNRKPDKALLDASASVHERMSVAQDKLRVTLQHYNSLPLQTIRGRSTFSKNGSIELLTYAFKLCKRL